MNNYTHTIVAIATPLGRGGIGILRISGDLTIKVAQELLNILPKPRQATYLPFLHCDGNIIDKGIAIFFPKPCSFTGEDMLELQGHGSPIALKILLKRILKIPGVYIARPGEFSKRAFLNNKLDLTQAEAITDLINASSVQAARYAINSLQGVFSKYIYKLANKIHELRVSIEASIDFSEEGVYSLSTKEIHSALNSIKNDINIIYNKAYDANQFREGKKIVIAGKPNVGKSSLLNALIGYDAAIVTNLPGTTRDIIHEQINIDDMLFDVIDTAGLRNDSNDAIENIGINRAWEEIKKADHVLFIVDNNELHSNILTKYDKCLLLNSIISLSKEIPVTLIRNKADLLKEKIGISDIMSYKLITISAKFGYGIDLLKKYLKYTMQFINNNEGNFLARQRHIQALKISKQHIFNCHKQLISSNYDEIIAEELRLAQQSLNEITGKFSSDDLLEKIFSSFCIGK